MKMGDLGWFEVGCFDNTWEGIEGGPFRISNSRHFHRRVVRDPGIAMFPLSRAIAIKCRCFSVPLYLTFTAEAPVGYVLGPDSYTLLRQCKTTHHDRYLTPPWPSSPERKIGSKANGAS
jgi:hypothetical protein